MTYSSSPRPTFDGPAPIPYRAVTRHLWGNEESGEVADWIYVSSDQIHQLVFGLPPGGSFTHSQAYRTIFAADEVLYVLNGELVLANPESGEVHRILPGEAAFFRRDTWHHAWNSGVEELRVLELFAPPPSQGTSGAYARSRPYLHHARYTRDEYLGNWPAMAREARHEQTIQVIRTPELMWRLEGDAHPILIGILASTEHLTAGTVRLLGGQRSDVRRHSGSMSLYVVEGHLHVRLTDQPTDNWHELSPGDGFYLPAGTPYQYYNMSADPVAAVFGVAPSYLSDDGK